MKSKRATPRIIIRDAIIKIYCNWSYNYWVCFLLVSKWFPFPKFRFPSFLRSSCPFFGLSTSGDKIMGGIGAARRGTSSQNQLVPLAAELSAESWKRTKNPRRKGERKKTIKIADSWYEYKITYFDRLFLKIISFIFQKFLLVKKKFPTFFSSSSFFFQSFFQLLNSSFITFQLHRFYTTFQVPLSEILILKWPTCLKNFYLSSVSFPFQCQTTINKLLISNRYISKKKNFSRLISLYLFFFVGNYFSPWFGGTVIESRMI